MTALAALDRIPAVLRASSDCLWRGGKRSFAWGRSNDNVAPIPAIMHCSCSR